MPEKFQIVMQCLLQLPDEQFKFKNLINLLLAEESHQFLHEKELSFASGPVVQEVRQVCKSPVSCSRGKSQERKNFFCFRCHKPGHYAKDCFSKIPVNKSNNHFKSKNRYVKKSSHYPHAIFQILFHTML